MFSAGRQGFFGGMSDVVLDPRETLWKISDMPDKNVQAFLNQFAQKTGITALVPDAWNPSVSKALKEGKAHVAIPALAKAAGGASEEFFFIRKPGRNPDGERMAGGPPDAGDAGG